MAYSGYWQKKAKLDLGSIGTRSSSEMDEEKIISVGILTVSDRCARGEAQDLSGRNLKEMITKLDKYCVTVKVQKIVPDETEEIKNTLRDWADNYGLALILTTGGTGFSPRDVTPEATRMVIDKECPAMMVAITIAGLTKTKHAMLSRAVCGIRNNILIVNFPGSLKASKESLEVIMPVLPHSIALLRNENDNVHQQSGGNNYLLTATPPPSQDNLLHTRIPTNINTQCFMSTPDLNGAQHSIGSQHATHSLLSESSINMAVDCDEDICSAERRSIGVVGNLPLSTLSDSAISGLGSTDLGKVARRLRTSPYPLTSMDKAFSLIIANSTRLHVVVKPYTEAVGHILAEDVRATGPLPPFPASVMDGYAVIASETPGDFDVIGVSVCNRTNNSAKATMLNSGQILRINTGAPLPRGANAVVPVEDTLLLEEEDDGETEVKVRVLKSMVAGQYVRPIGNDIKKGEVVVKSGVRLGPSEIGLLASVGATSLKVYQLPVVAVFSTGSELADPCIRNLGPGEIRDSNRISLKLALNKQGYKVVDLGIIPDDRSLLKAILLQACDKADVIVSTGGVSMGEHDYIKPTLVELGAKIHFGRVFMKPGKPTTFATIDTRSGRKCFFALPGNPVSALVTCNLFVLPSLRRLSGCKEPRSTIIKVKLSSDVRLDSRPEYQRVHLRWEPQEVTPWADSTGRQISSRLLSMLTANALLMLPPKNDKCSEVKMGGIVDAMVIDEL